MLASLVLGLVVGAHAGAVELTSDNFDELVTNSGKVHADTHEHAALPPSVSEALH